MMDEKNWREEELYKLLEKLTRLYHDAEDEKLRKLFKDQIQDVESDLRLQDE
jgi:iron-sulfur cluster repair protein YtfE (RIC family)